MMKTYKRKEYIIEYEEIRRRDNKLLGSRFVDKFDSLEELKNYLKTCEDLKRIKSDEIFEELNYSIYYYDEDDDVLDNYDVELGNDEIEKEYQEIEKVIRNNDNYIIDNYLCDLIEDGDVDLKQVTFYNHEITTDDYKVECDNIVVNFNDLDTTGDYISKLLDEGKKKLKDIKVYRKYIKLKVNVNGSIIEDNHYEDVYVF